MWPFGGSDEERTSPPALDRVVSGIPRLDYILKGGFLRGGDYMILGPPGSGKTILGNQFCFNHVANSEGRCVYMTLLVESHAKMLRHLASLEFFRPEMIPEGITYVSGYQALRGDGLRGKHEVEITGRGIVIHPRTEIQFDKPPEQAAEQRVRMPFGVAELDRMLWGGLPSGSTTALLGAPGAGKTSLGLSFLVEGARQGQKGIYFGFYEPPPRLMEKARQVGIDLQEYVEAGLIEVHWQPPLEHLLDSPAEQLLEKIKEDEPSRRRLFIDGIEGFRAASVYPDRMPRFLSAFCNQLRTYDVTAVVSEELALFRAEIDMPNPELANVVETVIMLRYVELRSQLYRLISIMKMRESRYDTSIREFRITDGGPDVAATFGSAEVSLTDHGRAVPSGPGGSGAGRGEGS